MCYRNEHIFKKIKCEQFSERRLFLSSYGDDSCEKGELSLSVTSMILNVCINSEKYIVKGNEVILEKYEDFECKNLKENQNLGTLNKCFFYIDTVFKFSLTY